ncbi:MAG: hypothetical protein ACIWVG_11365 [Gloeotrichia echinulata HAB0833]
MLKSFESDCQYIINAAHNFAVKNPDLASDVGHYSGLLLCINTII